MIQIVTIAGYLKYFFAPHFCEQCKKFLDRNTILCSECMASIQHVVSYRLPITKKYTMSVFALGGYQDPIKPLILAKSFSNKLAAIQLAELIWEKSLLAQQSFDYIVPVPLHWTRYSYRGYNQAEIIAQELSKRSGKPMLNLVKRIDRRPFQSSLPIYQRHDNVANNFTLVEIVPELKGKEVLVVDDLMTTGSTLKEVARCLLPYRPKALKAIVAARAC